MKTHAQRLLHLKNNGFTPRTVLDIGAHSGLWSRMVKTVYPEANIFMVEANKQHTKSLKSTKNRFEIALLGDRRRESVDYFTAAEGNNTGNSIYKEQTNYFKDDNCLVKKLPMFTLDFIVEKNNLSGIDFLKLDVQGAEVDILKGATNTIKDVEFILLELQILEYNAGAPGFTQVNEYMESIGYTINDLYEVHYLPTGHLNEIDFLYARKGSKFIKKGVLC